jgi:hypothetical protein
MEAGSFAYSLVPYARVVRTGKAYLIVNPVLGTWAKISRYAGVMLDRLVGISIQGIVDTVGPAYGREALVSLRSSWKSFRLEDCLFGSSQRGPI